jgi:hypothetical protein
MRIIEHHGYASRMSLRTPAARRLATRRIVALRLIAGVLHATAYTHEHQRRILGDSFEAQAWLRVQLAPLARHDWLIAELLRVLDPERPPRRWTSPRTVKQELLLLAAQAQQLGAIKRKSQT